MLTRAEALRVLGLHADADADDIRHAYLAMAREHHPDVADGCKLEAAERFRSIVDAYERVSARHTKACGVRTPAQQYSDLMAQRSREPFIIRWFWRGPSMRVKFQLKLLTMATLFVAALVDEVGRETRARHARNK